MANKTLEMIGDFAQTGSTVAKAGNLFVQRSAKLVCNVPDKLDAGFNKISGLAGKSVDLLDIELDYQIEVSKSNNTLDLSILKETNSIIMADKKSLSAIAQAKAKARIAELQPSKTLDF